MMSKEHELKCWTEYFSQVWRFDKPFEIRFNDRDYQEGDIIHLNECTIEGYYSGRRITAEISCVCDFEQKKGFVVLGLSGVTRCVQGLVQD